jgi:preprotein translocase subunit SecB
MSEVRNASTSPSGQNQSDTPVFSVNSIYIKDLSFESPNAPDIFNAEWQPKVDFDLQMATKVLNEAEGLHEVVIHITVTVKVQEDTTAFLIDVQQAGIFIVHKFEEEVSNQILLITCPTVLFPYARETVSNLVQRGGFPQLLLPPINFEAMYAQQKGEGATDPVVTVQ